MDKRILVLLVALIVIVGSFVIIKSCQDDKPAPKISSLPLIPKPDELVSFKCENCEIDDNIEWSFGDGDSSSGIDVKHSYKKTGSYKVTASNGGQKKSNLIEINVIAEKITQIIKPTIIIPSKIKAGETITMTDKTQGASKWSWAIKENGAGSQFQSFDISFDKPGNYTLLVNVSGDHLIGADTIQLLVLKSDKIVKGKGNDNPYVPPPPPKSPLVAEPPKLNYLPPTDFISKFQAIANGIYENDDNAKDQWSSDILSQTCNGQLQVVINYSDGSKIVGVPERRSANSFKDGLLFRTYKLLKIQKATGGGKNCFSEITLEVDSVNK